MSEITSKQVINGTFGEAWVDSDYMAEITGMEAVIDIEYEDVNRPRRLGTGKKMIGFAGTGTLNFNKVSSRFINLVSEKLKNGQQVSVNIISKLDDPDALGAERIAIKNATFTNLTLANWEAKAMGQHDAPFEFDDWEPLDLIG